MSQGITGTIAVIDSGIPSQLPVTAKTLSRNHVFLWIEKPLLVGSMVSISLREVQHDLFDLPVSASESAGRKLKIQAQAVIETCSAQRNAEGQHLHSLRFTGNIRIIE